MQSPRLHSYRDIDITIHGPKVFMRIPEARVYLASAKLQWNKYKKSHFNYLSCVIPHSLPWEGKKRLECTPSILAFGELPEEGLASVSPDSDPNGEPAYFGCLGCWEQKTAQWLGVVLEYFNHRQLRGRSAMDFPLGQKEEWWVNPMFWLLGSCEELLSMSSDSEFT